MSVFSRTPDIFQGISDADLEKMLVCFQAQFRHSFVGETLLTYANHFEKMGVMINGEADLVRFDQDGNRTLIEHLMPGDVFGEMFAVAFRPDKEELALVASKDCEYLFIDYSHLIKRCPNACSYHSILVSNTLQLMTQKARDLNARIETLSRRTLRQKLITYFEIQASQLGSAKFRLPFSLEKLADYLCVDRSAMLREMKKLRDEGFIVSKGRAIELLGLHLSSRNTH